MERIEELRYALEAIEAHIIKESTHVLGFNDEATKNNFDTLQKLFGDRKEVLSSIKFWEGEEI